MAEFTGERVVPELVEPDLWNEHLVRYLFAARLARHKRVADAACGAGYGTAELARVAALAVGLDRAAEAVDYANAHYRRANLKFLQADCTATPFPDSTFDLVIAFEVIEHLAGWRALLEEARRLLAPAGQFIVSTPNRLYYSETRIESGPNPFHEREFSFTEFREALLEYFPNVSFFLQNHTPALVIQPVAGASAAELRLESPASDPESAHFFIAVCALSHQLGAPTFVYVPNTSNVLRERELHIARLGNELAQKDLWLQQAQADHQALLDRHRAQKLELEERNQWAQQLNQQLEEAQRRVVELQSELAAEQAAAAVTVAGYEAKIVELDAENRQKTAWALETEERLTAELQARDRELRAAVDLLDQREREIEERTAWALKLDSQRDELAQRLAAVSASRWYRLGRKFGLGPDVQD